jgi:hypothetical protein
MGMLQTDLLHQSQPGNSFPVQWAGTLISIEFTVAILNMMIPFTPPGHFSGLQNAQTLASSVLR